MKLIAYYLFVFACIAPMAEGGHRRRSGGGSGGFWGETGLLFAKCHDGSPPDFVVDQYYTDFLDDPTGGLDPYGCCACGAEDSFEICVCLNDDCYTSDDYDCTCEDGCRTVSDFDCPIDDALCTDYNNGAASPPDELCDCSTDGIDLGGSHVEDVSCDVCIDRLGFPCDHPDCDCEPCYETYDECLCNECGFSNLCPDSDPGMLADPHLKTWDGQFYDYMGECDLKLAHVPLFDGTNDMDINVRTRIRYDYSFIESAVLQIGGDVFEVSSFAEYAFNGVVGGMEGHRLPSIGGYPVVHTQINPKKEVYAVLLDQHQNITFSTFKDWVSVQIFGGNKKTFGKVSGLMGTFEGKMLGRNGTDLSEDINALGQDWQIGPEEKMLFRTIKPPQAAKKCILPSEQSSVKAAGRRRLGESIIKSTAEKACSHWRGKSFTNCVHDVMVNGDIDLASDGAF